MRQTRIDGSWARRGGAVALAFGAGVVVTAIALGGGGAAVAQDEGVGGDGGDAGMAMPPEMQEAWQQYQELAEPSEHHQRMARYLGTWDCDVSMFMDPAAPPMQSKGTATFEWLFEDRWMTQEFSGNMMGESFRGFGLSGYDNHRKQFVDMWVDDMSTSMMTMRGGTMPGSDVIVSFGEIDEPMTGEIGKIIRNVITHHSDDHFSFEMQEVMYGEPFTVMRIDYRRRK